MQKDIYKYNNGSKDVYVDPLLIQYRFNKSAELEDVDTLFGWISQRDDENGKSTDDGRLQVEGAIRLAPHIARAFDVPMVDPDTGEGFTSLQLINMWSDYIDYMISVKKNTESQQTSVSSTDSEASSSTESSTTKRGSGSS